MAEIGNIATRATDRILGIRISLLGVTELLEHIGAFIRLGRRATIASGNAHSLNIAGRCLWFRRFLIRADLIRLDGAGLQLAAWLLGRETAARNTWADFAWKLAEYAATNGFKLFFFGGEPGVAQAAAQRLRERCSELQIAGIQHGYIDLHANCKDSRELVERINAVQPDILIVGLGMPRQEAWLTHHRASLAVPVAMTAGAVFDYVSGRVRRAPFWMQQTGLEWAYRLIQDPRRMWKRYLYGNPVFLMHVLAERIVGRHRFEKADRQFESVPAVLEMASHPIAVSRRNVMGLPLDFFTAETLLARIIQLARTRQKSILANVNMHALNIAHATPWFRTFIAEATHVFCDGYAAILTARWQHGRSPCRLTYADWFPVMAAAAAKAEVSIYLLGAPPGIAERANAQLQLIAPGLRVVGTHHGFFDKTPGSRANTAVLARIRQAEPDLLLVGFGMPLQEKWIQQNRDRIDATVILPCGAAIEYLAGEIRRAPGWMTEHGLEWLGRMFIQPRRLFRRYTTGVPTFFWHLVKWQRQRGTPTA